VPNPFLFCAVALTRAWTNSELRTVRRMSVPLKPVIEIWYVVSPAGGFAAGVALPALVCVFWLLIGVKVARSAPASPARNSVGRVTV
jgi:hypothetical protein